jgi:hypothetical protein
MMDIEKNRCAGISTCATGRGISAQRTWFEEASRFKAPRRAAAKKEIDDAGAVLTEDRA